MNRCQHERLELEPTRALVRWRRRLAAAMMSLTVGCSALAAPGPRTIGPGNTSGVEADVRPTLLIMLDALPLAVVERAIAESGGTLFSGLTPPAPMVSSFPSTTTAALAGMFAPLGMKLPPGYEAKFFDRARARVRGGGPISYKRIKTNWPQFFDWRTTSLLRKSIGFLRPVKASHREITSAVDAFLASDADYFFAYIASSDGAAHLRGPETLAPMLHTLHAELERARRERDFAVVVFSDHGIAGDRPLVNSRKAIKQALRRGGFRPGTKLRRENDVALVPFGLLSSLVAFTMPGREAEAARVIAGVEGVELCASPTPQGARVVAGEGEATIRFVPEEARGEERLVYEVVSGDPLGYAAWAGIARDGKEWRDLTIDHRFPDAPHRILRAFDIVENPASVVCSNADGFMYGPWTTEWPGRLTVGRLRFTHGALEREASLGFVLGDHPALRSVRARSFDEVLSGIVPRDFRSHD